MLLFLKNPLFTYFYLLLLFPFGRSNWQENIPIEEVFENLRCTREGLTSEAAQERLTIFGYNKLEEKKVFFPFNYFFMGKK